MTESARPEGRRARCTYPAWQRRHEAVLRYLLEHPAARHAEVAAATGYGVSHLPRIVNAPEFRRRWDAAMAELFRAARAASLAGRLVAGRDRDGRR